MKFGNDQGKEDEIFGAMEKSRLKRANLLSVYKKNGNTTEVQKQLMDTEQSILHYLQAQRSTEKPQLVSEYATF